VNVTIPSYSKTNQRQRLLAAKMSFFASHIRVVLLERAQAGVIEQALRNLADVVRSSGQRILFNAVTVPNGLRSSLANAAAYACG
jgi:hypothetical protein